jgi:hypothetical protein
MKDPPKKPTMPHVSKVEGYILVDADGGRQANVSHQPATQRSAFALFAKSGKYPSGFGEPVIAELKDQGPG